MQLDEAALPLPHPTRQVFPRLRLRRRVAMLFLLLALTAGLGASGELSSSQRWRTLDAIVGGWDWDLAGWMASALTEKLQVELAQPVRGLSAAEQSTLAEGYLARAAEIARLEATLDQLLAEADVADSAVQAQIRQQRGQLAYLRGEQELERPAVEQVIEAQIGEELRAEGIRLGALPFPPVLFTFSEPPRKLVVSPRERIETIYYAMLEPALPPDARVAIEDNIMAPDKLSAYVASIGGLGAYPTLVVDRAPLDWVLSTVAHEWAHNYLTLFPLGINYDRTPELTILNETVAEIVGDELGARALQRNYAPPVSAVPGSEPAPVKAVGPLPPDAAPPFDFRAEMQQTRATVDQFLAAGRVEDAEAYMAMRRQLFAENGYHLRRLNQAYFAFHGNYGTGPAATSPIGPKLERLRSLVPDLHTFLTIVRWFTSEADLDRALAEWAQAAGGGD